MMRRTVFGALIALGAATSALLSMSRSDGFPHEEHAGLFPTCLGCHSGIPEGDAKRYYSVRGRDCVRCHDGEREDAVAWEAPVKTVSNLVFSHVEHVDALARAEEETLRCTDCHGPLEADRPRMAVRRASPETCAGCHAHEVAEHLAAEAPCAACHASLAETPDLGLARLAAFPKPPSHAAEAFVLDHGAAAVEAESCAVCHARESCARCHLNAERVPEIARLAPDTRIRLLVRDSVGEWPEPPDHTFGGWEFVHGEEAIAASASCANCHSEPSCRTCHGVVAIDAIDALPEVSDDGPAGVVVSSTGPAGHLPDFGVRHGAAAAADLPRCVSCHVETECAQCHEDPSGKPRATGGSKGDGGPGLDGEMSLGGLFSHVERPRLGPPPEPRPGYHPANFLMRHGAEVFAVQTTCADCHSTEVFCRDCHQSTGFGVAVDGGAGGAFHDAQPNWFFEHGRAARQGLEACASCHQQTSCLRCHSARAGLRINPHGPSFDPARLSARSTISCGLCHTGDQIPPP